MSKYFVCCERCFENIGRKNASAAKLWLDLCAVRLLKGEIFSVKGSDVPSLRSLELLGYVCTTDQPHHIIIRMNGHTLTDDGQDFFCLKKGCHE